LNKKIVYALAATFALTALASHTFGCHTPRPARTLQKFFYYEDLNTNLFPDVKNLPVEGLPVDVAFSYQGVQYNWHFVTDTLGKVELAGVPSGSYHFNWTWNGDAQQETLSICCAKRVWVFENFCEAKGCGCGTKS
jgi:hypothetical protein